MTEKTNVPEIRFAGFTDPWEQRKLGEIAPVTMGQSPNGACYTDNPSDAILVQGNADLKDGWVSPRVWTTEITKTAKAGELIMSVRAPVGAMGKTAYDVVLGRGVAGIAGNEFLFQALSKKEAEGYWATVSAGSTFDSISGNELRNTPVDCPRSELEREVIGDCMSKVDSLITLHQRKRRNGPSTHPLVWEQRKLGEFSKKKTTKNADGALSETFTNSAEQGVISQLDYFDHDITNDANISGYYVVQPDDFVYNPRISVTAPCGPINRNRLNRAGVMSPLYTVFSVDTSVDKTYLEHYFKTSRWHDFMFLEGNTGARSDRFSISDATFFEMPIWCPGVSEQMAIAKQLETTDSLITLHQRQLDGNASDIIFSPKRKTAGST